MGCGLWVHDVLGFRGSPAAWREALLWAAMMHLDGRMRSTMAI